MTPEAISAQAVTAVVRRRIRRGCEGRFEALMQEFISFVLRQPGHLGINVIRPDAESRDYTVVDRFASEADRRRFTSSPEYIEWMQRLRELTESEPRIAEMGGVAFWFTLPHQPPRPAPPKVKMSLLTLLGVYPLSLVIPALVLPLVPHWPGPLKGLLIAALMVASLTWVVMPNITRLFHRWLFPETERQDKS